MGCARVDDGRDRWQSVHQGERTRQEAMWVEGEVGSLVEAGVPWSWVRSGQGGGV